MEGNTFLTGVFIQPVLQCKETHCSMRIKQVLLLLINCFYSIPCFIIRNTDAAEYILQVLKLVMKNSFLIVILSVVLNFILIRSMGVMGAIISINIITFLSMCVHIILAMREFKSVGISAHEIIPQKKDFVTVKENISLFRDKFRK